MRFIKHIINGYRLYKRAKAGKSALPVDDAGSIVYDLIWKLITPKRWYIKK
jgi:hypothetical protein